MYAIWYYKYRIRFQNRVRHYLRCIIIIQNPVNRNKIFVLFTDLEIFCFACQKGIWCNIIDTRRYEKRIRCSTREWSDIFNAIRNTLFSQHSIGKCFFPNNFQVFRPFNMFQLFTFIKTVIRYFGHLVWHRNTSDIGHKKSSFSNIFYVFNIVHGI